MHLYKASLNQVFLEEGNPSKYYGPLPSEKQALFQLAKGLDYFHCQRLVHRDVKPENVLIAPSTVGGSVVLKWAGFGLSMQVDTNGSYSTKMIQGSVKWMAPELLQFLCQSYSKVDASVLADVFSTGCLFFSYVTGGIHPFGNGMEIVYNIKDFKPVNSSSLPVSHYARQVIIDVMMAKDPLKRVDWMESLQNCLLNSQENNTAARVYFT